MAIVTEEEIVVEKIEDKREIELRDREGRKKYKR